MSTYTQKIQDLPQILKKKRQTGNLLAESIEHVTLGLRFGSLSPTLDVEVTLNNNNNNNRIFKNKKGRQLNRKMGKRFRINTPQKVKSG